MDTQLCVCLGVVCICVEWGLWVLYVYVGAGCVLGALVCNVYTQMYLYLGALFVYI